MVCFFKDKIKSFFSLFSKSELKSFFSYYGVIAGSILLLMFFILLVLLSPLLLITFPIHCFNEYSKKFFQDKIDDLKE